MYINKDESIDHNTPLNTAIPAHALEGFKLGYILGKFRDLAVEHKEHGKDRPLDWSLPTTSKAWHSRLTTGSYISATAIEEAVDEGHFFCPTLFLSHFGYSASVSNAYPCLTTKH